MEYELNEHYPIYGLSGQTDEYIQNNIENHLVDFNNCDLKLENSEIVKIIKHLLESTNNARGKIRKIIFSIIIFHIIFSNIDFLKKHIKFKDVVYNKVIEFKNNDYEIFEKYKIITNNENFVDICERFFNILNDKPKNMFVEKTFDELIVIDEITKSHSILLENYESKFNFKVTNEYDSEKFYKIIYTLSKLNKDPTIILLTMYEIFINNIKIVLENNDLKEKIKKQIKEDVTYNLKIFEKYKSYNNNINPIITISRLLAFYLE